MATLDYTPTIDGQPYNPAAAGGTVTRLRLWGNPTRTGSPVADVSDPTNTIPGIYTFTLPDTLLGRFWATVNWTKDATPESAVTDTSARVDLPVDPRLVCTPEDVAARLDLTLPLTIEQREQITDAILDAQADVESYLNRTNITGTIYPVTDVYPSAGVDVTDWRAWPQLSTRFDDQITVIAATPSTTLPGAYDVTLLVGIDGRAEQPIVRFVRTHATELLRDNPDIKMGKRLPTSISTDGQSVSYQQGRSGMQTEPGKAGAIPNVKMLNRYRRVPAFRRATVPDLPWPYRWSPLRGF